MNIHAQSIIIGAAVVVMNVIMNVAYGCSECVRGRLLVVHNVNGKHKRVDRFDPSVFADGQFVGWSGFFTFRKGVQVGKKHLIYVREDAHNLSQHDHGVFVS